MQKILDNFVGDIKFIELIKKEYIDSNTLYTIRTNQGDYLIFKVDYFTSFYHIVKEIRDILDYGYKFIEVNNPLNKFEDSPQSKFYINKETGNIGWKTLQKYLEWESDSKGSYFNFLIKRTSSKKDLEAGATFLTNTSKKYYSHLKKRKFKVEIISPKRI